MADIELLIRIDEEYIEQIDKIKFLIGGIEDRSLQINVINAIKNGMPLPKGHGDLIDRKELLKQPIDMANYPSNYVKIAPPIIKADIESEDKSRKQ